MTKIDDTIDFLNDRFTKSGYNTNLFKNLGLLFIGIIGLVLCIGLILVLRLLEKKKKM
jgi:hypothetical protein